MPTLTLPFVAEEILEAEEDAIHYIEFFRAMQKVQKLKCTRKRLSELISLGKKVQFKQARSAYVNKAIEEEVSVLFKRIKALPIEHLKIKLTLLELFCRSTTGEIHKNAIGYYEQLAIELIENPNVDSLAVYKLIPNSFVFRKDLKLELFKRCLEQRNLI